MAADRAYANLLTHLQRPESRIPFQTVLSAVPHYLAELPLPHPTQLTAFVISSTIWQPLSVNSVRSLITLYRSAVKLKESNLQNQVGAWFSRDPSTLLAEWVSAVMKGASRGDPQLRIAILGGLLLGLNDLAHADVRDWIRRRLEGQVVIACSEMLETSSTTEDTWRSEFKVSDTDGIVDARESLFLYSAYHVLPLVATERLMALDLRALARLALKGIESAFCSGELLSQLSTSATRRPNGRVATLPESRLASCLQTMGRNKLYEDVGSLARLLSRCLSLVADQTPLATWLLFRNTCQSLKSITCKVERDWKNSVLAALPPEDEMDSESRVLSTEVWKALKTLLFTHLIVSQSILSPIPYLQPNSRAPDQGPSTIACLVLHSLHHLSFVISQFGGVASSGEGFKELKRVFYMALDIVAADVDPRTSSILVEQLLSRIQNSQMEAAHPLRLSQIAYTLAVVEQLMPLLDESRIENTIVPFCQPYLCDTKHRETYESAHSVMLSIFAAHPGRKDKKGSSAGLKVAERLVPFYVDSLLQNANEDHLSASQFRLAYSSLVRSAAFSGDGALVWLCIDALLVHLEAFTLEPSSGSSMHLYLTLVSLISCVPLSLLSRLLSEIEKVLDSVEDTSDKVELGKAVLEEIMNKVGDREKEVVLSWWCRVASKFMTALEKKHVAF